MFRHDQRLGKRFFALLQLSIFLFQLFLGFLCRDDQMLVVRFIAYQQEDDQAGDQKDDDCEQQHILAQDVGEGIFEQPVAVLERKIFCIILTDHVDAAVQKAQKSVVADLNAEAVVINTAQLNRYQFVVLMIAQDIAGSHTVEDRTACLIA